MVHNVAKFYESYIPIYAKGDLIDLGCGSVPLYGWYKKYVRMVTCVDWAKTPHNSKYIDIECDLSTYIPVQDGAFDTIILSDVLEHIPNPDNIWAEMNRVLRKDGILFLNVPFMYWIHEIPHDFYRYTEFSLRRFCENYGFEILEFVSLGGKMDVFADMTAKTLLKIPLLGKYFSLLIQSLVINLKSNELVSVSKQTNLYPLGYGMVLKKNI